MKSKKMSADQRRASILEHSKKVFARKGLHGVSVSDLAEECAVSPAVLYQHFRSKEDLYEAAVNDYASRREDYVDAVLSGPSDFANVLYRITVVFVKGRISDPDSVRIELRSLIEADDVREKFFTNHWKGLTDYVESGLLELHASGAIERVDVRIAILSYVALVRHVVISLSLGDPGLNGELDVEYYVKGVVDLFLRGVNLPALKW